MDDDFELPIVYKGAEISLPARLLQFGYSYRIEVDVEGVRLHLERDDQGDWRALMGGEANSDKAINRELVEAIVAGIIRIT